MAIRKFPKIQSDKVFYRLRGHLMFAYVDVRRFHVIVTFYNGYSLLFVRVRLRKCVLLDDVTFSRALDELIDNDLLFLNDAVLRLIIYNALTHLSSFSLDDLVDSYKSASKFFPSNVF